MRVMIGLLLVVGSDAFRIAPTMGSSGLNRRRALERIAACTFAAAAVAGPALADTSSVQKALDQVAKYEIPVNEILGQLKSQGLKGGPDDSAVVLRYLSSYYDPLQKAMLSAAPALGLDQEQQKRAELLPLLMKGHLLELTAACRSGDPKEQLQEVEEVSETLEEFLALARSRYEVKSPVAMKAVTPAEYYGLFGCDAYGLKRKPNSNQCTNE